MTPTPGRLHRSLCGVGPGFSVEGQVCRHDACAHTHTSTLTSVHPPTTSQPLANYRKRDRWTIELAYKGRSDDIPFLLDHLMPHPIKFNQVGLPAREERTSKCTPASLFSFSFIYLYLLNIHIYHICLCVVRAPPQLNPPPPQGLEARVWHEVLWLGGCSSHPFLRVHWDGGHGQHSTMRA